MEITVANKGLCPACGSMLKEQDISGESYSVCPTCSLAWWNKTESPLGIKHDESKLEWSLLPFAEIEDVIKVLMHGKAKYSAGNWRYVKPKERYIDAAYRHLTARAKGEILDPESGSAHTICAVACLLFLTWHDKEESKNG